MFYTCCLIISLAVLPKLNTRTPKNRRSKQNKTIPKNTHTKKTRNNNKKPLPSFPHISITLLLGFLFFKVKFQSAVSHPLNETIFYCKLKKPLNKSKTQ